MCQGCVDKGRITQKVYDALTAFETKWPDSAFGPAHVVIDDANVEDDNIRWCLDHWDEHAQHGGSETESRARAEEYEATKTFLRELLTWPIEDRIGSTP